MTRALVIKSYGDKAIAGAIADGMTRQAQSHSSEALRRVAMQQHTPEEWAAMTAKARFDYGQDRPHGRVYHAAMGAWGLVWSAIDGWYKYLSAWNREG